MDKAAPEVHAGGVMALVALSALAGCAAGMAAYVVAYEHAFQSQGRRAARRIALRAVPGPFAYFVCLGLVVGFLLPIMIRRFR